MLFLDTHHTVFKQQLCARTYLKVSKELIPLAKFSATSKSVEYHLLAVLGFKTVLTSFTSENVLKGSFFKYYLPS